jgi:hypothetical protein
MRHNSHASTKPKTNQAASPTKSQLSQLTAASSSDAEDVFVVFPANDGPKRRTLHC